MKKTKMVSEFRIPIVLNAKAAPHAFIRVAAEKFQLRQLLDVVRKAIHVASTLMINKFCAQPILMSST